MKKNKNDQKETKGQETKAVKSAEEKQAVEKSAMIKLLNETKRKLSGLAKDVSTVPRKKYTGWKLGSKLLVTIGPRNKSFMMWVYQYSQKTGTRLNIEEFEIKTTGKASEDVIAGLIKKVKRNYDILTAIQAKREMAEPKKETFAEATIVKGVPIIKTNKKETVSA
ncbi:hypothetical protein ACFLQZ_01655 [Acidobacteriota bacterium]